MMKDRSSIAAKLEKPSPMLRKSACLELLGPEAEQRTDSHKNAGVCSASGRGRAAGGER